MTNAQFKGRVKQKYDTEANWTSKNPVLLQGEIAFSVTSDGIRMKVGDGTSAFNTLKYIDDVLRNYVDEVVQGLNFGFVATEEDM